MVPALVSQLQVGTCLGAEAGLGKWNEGHRGVCRQLPLPSRASLALPRSRCCSSTCLGRRWWHSGWFGCRGEAPTVTCQVHDASPIPFSSPAVRQQRNLSWSLRSRSDPGFLYFLSIFCYMSVNKPQASPGCGVGVSSLLAAFGG